MLELASHMSIKSVQLWLLECLLELKSGIPRIYIHTPPLYTSFVVLKVGYLPVWYNSLMESINGRKNAFMVGLSFEHQSPARIVFLFENLWYTVNLFCYYAGIVLWQ